jgi:hypothetical protein
MRSSEIISSKEKSLHQSFGSKQGQREFLFQKKKNTAEKKKLCDSHDVQIDQSTLGTHSVFQEAPHSHKKAQDPTTAVKHLQNEWPSPLFVPHLGLQSREEKKRQEN